MNGDLAIQESLPGRVNSLILPLTELQLLVPVTAVAEVVAGHYPVEPGEQQAPGFQGWIHWRHQRIPLVSFEGAQGLSVPSPGRDERLAVLNAIGEGAELGYFAVPLADYPSPVHITRETPLEAMDEPGSTETLILMMTNLEGRDLSVPDLLALEKRSLAPLL